MHNELKGFSSDQIAAIEALKEQRKTGPELPITVPFVTTDVLDRMRDTLNLPPYDTVNPATSLKSSSKIAHPYVRALQIANEILPRYTGKTGLTERIKEWISKNGGGTNYSADATLAGMMVVLKTFQVMMGADFLDKLESIPPRNLIEGFNDSVPIFDFSTEIGKIANNRSIPEHQPFLKQLVDDFILASPCESNVEAGAHKMYSFLELNWNNIYPENASSI